MRKISLSSASLYVALLGILVTHTAHGFGLRCLFRKLVAESKKSTAKRPTVLSLEPLEDRTLLNGTPLMHPNIPPTGGVNPTAVLVPPPAGGQSVPILGAVVAMGAPPGHVAGGATTQNAPGRGNSFLDPNTLAMINGADLTKIAQGNLLGPPLANNPVVDSVAKAVDSVAKEIAANPTVDKVANEVLDTAAGVVTDVAVKVAYPSVQKADVQLNAEVGHAVTNAEAQVRKILHHTVNDTNKIIDKTLGDVGREFPILDVLLKDFYFFSEAHKGDLPWLYSLFAEKVDKVQAVVHGTEKKGLKDADAAIKTIGNDVTADVAQATQLPSKKTLEQLGRPIVAKAIQTTLADSIKNRRLPSTETFIKNVSQQAGPEVRQHIQQTISTLQTTLEKQIKQVEGNIEKQLTALGKHAETQLKALASIDTKALATDVVSLAIIGYYVVEPAIERAHIQLPAVHLTPEEKRVLQMAEKQFLQQIEEKIKATYGIISNAQKQLAGLAGRAEGQIKTVAAGAAASVAPPQLSVPNPSLSSLLTPNMIGYLFRLPHLPALPSGASGRPIEVRR